MAGTRQHRVLVRAPAAGHRARCWPELSSRAEAFCAAAAQGTVCGVCATSAWPRSPPGLAPPQWQVSPSRTPSNRLGLLNVRQEAPYTPRSLGFTKSDVAFANQIGRLGPLHPDPGGTGPGHGPPVGFGRESGPPRSRDDCAARQTSSAQAGLTASTVSRIYKPTYFLRVF